MSHPIKAKFMLIALSLLLFLCAGCTAPENVGTKAPDSQTAASFPPAETSEPENPNEKEDHTMQITIGSNQFTVLLEDNKTTAVLLEKLPLQLSMSELNGNEKYNYLPFSLPTEPYSPGQIQAGDVMLYGDDCLVVFYKSFSTPYRYTRIGHIDDPAGLQAAVGPGSVQMEFSK